MRPGLPPLPQQMQHLPMDSRGYPVPWFVTWYDGRPDFRVIDTAKIYPAIYSHLCWICGTRIADSFVFVKPSGSGPIAREPACHMECAQWAVRACPFLLSTVAYRSSPDDAVPMPGVERTNPHVFELWATKQFRQVKAADGGLALELGEPERLEVYERGEKINGKNS